MSDSEDKAYEDVLDTLIDCITSFGVHGDIARAIAVYILSENSGLAVATLDGITA